jgi:hypothetical protein
VRRKRQYVNKTFLRRKDVEEWALVEPAWEAHQRQCWETLGRRVVLRLAWISRNGHCRWKKEQWNARRAGSVPITALRAALGRTLDPGAQPFHAAAEAIGNATAPAPTDGALNQVAVGNGRIIVDLSTLQPDASCRRSSPISIHESPDMNDRRTRSIKPLALTDGRTLTSLRDAREFLLSLPPERRALAPWRYAADLLKRAEDRNEKYSTMDARAQLARALSSEGFL